MDNLKRIKEITNNASPEENWAFGANYPFYVDVSKPAPSLSKHDNERPTYWRYEDGLFVGMARHEMPKLIEGLELAIRALEYAAWSGYDRDHWDRVDNANKILSRIKEILK